MSTTMHDSQDWLISLTFAVPRGNETGDLSMVALECALAHHPESANGFSVAGDDRNIELVFNLDDASRDFADSVGAEMQEQVKDALTEELGSTPSTERSTCAA